MDSTIRTRFAPSPTGHLHIGNIRTGLFAWLFARSQGGTFILRIEDTDRARSTEEYIQNIYEDLRWLGLEWDEMYRQTDQIENHLAHARRLLDEGKAYRCVCTPEELEKRRKEELEQGKLLKVDRCRDLQIAAGDKPLAIRLKTPLDGVTEFDDKVYGKITVSNEEIDDLVLVRSDGTPTFNFACALDDHKMGITHVVRGDDHIANTPKQILILRAFGYDIPQYAHLSTILGADKTRLSKRHGATSIDWYKQNGYLPDAMINYLVRLGWASGDEEFFTREDLIEKFSLDSINRSPAIFNAEKLLWLNGEHTRASSADKLWKQIRPFIEEEGLAVSVEDDSGEWQGVYLCPAQWGENAEWRSKEWIADVLTTLQTRSKTLLEMRDKIRFYLTKGVHYEEASVAKHLKAEAREPLEDLIAGLGEMPEPWTEASLEELFNAIIEKRNVKMIKIAMPARVALTGQSVSPGIFDIVRLIGKNLSLQRLRKALERIS